jgi:hypothetical protein
VAVGFLLAAAVNIDSLDLLNSYLTDPQLRQQVIARSDEILAEKPASPDAQGRSSLASTRAQVNAATTQLSSKAKELEGVVQTLQSTLGPGEGQKIAASVQAGLQGLIDQVQGVQSGLGELDADVTETEQRIRGVTQSLTTSFPIGWHRFPNCRTTGSPDLRCGGRPEPFVEAQTPGWHKWLVWVTSVFPESYAEPVRARSLALAKASVERSAEFYQWLIGVLLTTVLVGLGSPFWVKVVSSALNLSRTAKNPNGGTVSTP